MALRGNEAQGRESQLLTVFITLRGFARDKQASGPVLLQASMGGRGSGSPLVRSKRKQVNFETTFVIKSSGLKKLLRDSECQVQLQWFSIWKRSCEVGLCLRLSGSTVCLLSKPCPGKL